MAKNEHKPEDGQVDLEFDEYEETTVELPSAEEKEEKEEVEVEVEEKQEASEDEHEKVSKNAERRIGRLTKKMREAERREQEAINYAKNVQAEAAQLKQKLQTVDHGYMNEYGNRLDIEQKQVENELKQAMQANDADKVVELQRKVAQLAVSAENYTKAQRAQQARQTEQPPQQQVQPQQVQQQVQQPPQQQVEQPLILKRKSGLQKMNGLVKTRL